MPTLLLGHGCEFLVAHLEMQGARMKLEITADYGGNPLLADEAAAREAIKNALLIATQRSLIPLETLAPLTLIRQDRWHPDTPAAFSPQSEGEQHQLITGTWTWEADASEVRLMVPKGSLHDVLLWTSAEHLPGKQAQWMLLIEGESSPALQVTKQKAPRWFTGSLLLALPLLLWALHSFNHRTPTVPKPTS